MNNMNIESLRETAKRLGYIKELEEILGYIKVNQSERESNYKWPDK